MRTEGKFVAVSDSTISFNRPVELSCESSTGKEFLIGQNPSRDGKININFIGANDVAAIGMINCYYKSLDGWPVARYIALPDWIQFCVFGFACLLILGETTGIYTFWKKKK
jgi:hypothetical protein